MRTGILQKPLVIQKENMIPTLFKRFFVRAADTCSFNNSCGTEFAKSKKECIDFAKIYIDNINVNGMRIKFLDRLCALRLGLSVPCKKLKVIKDEAGKVVGGFVYSFPEKNSLMINNLAIQKKSDGLSSKKGLKIFNGIKALIQNNNNIEKVVINVDDRAKKLLALYKKMGFEDVGILDDLENPDFRNVVIHRMSIKAKDFCKIF